MGPMKTYVHTAGSSEELCSSLVVLQRGCLQAGGHLRCGGIVKRRQDALHGKAKPLGEKHILLFKEKMLRSECGSRRPKIDSCVYGVAMGL